MGNKQRVEAGEVAWATSVRTPDFCLECELSLMEMKRVTESCHGCQLGWQSIRWSREERTMGIKSADIISNSLGVTQSIPLQFQWISCQLSSTVDFKKYPSFKCHHFILFQLCCSCSSKISLRPLKLSWRIPLASFSSIPMIFPKVLNNGDSFSKVSDATLSNGCLLPSNLPLHPFPKHEPSKGLFLGFKEYNHIEIIPPEMRFHMVQRRADLEPRASQVALEIKNLPANAWDVRDVGSIPGSGRSPGEGMATHCSILAWRILWTGEPGELQSTGLQRVRHNWSDLAHKHVHLFRGPAGLYMQATTFS